MDARELERLLFFIFFKFMTWRVVIVVLYGSVTWTMRMEAIKSLEVFEMWIWRKMGRVSWMELRTNE